MPLTQGAKVVLGLGGAFVAYRIAFSRGKASQESAMYADGAGRRPAVDKYGREVRNWPGAAEFDGKVVQKESGAVLQKPSMGDRLGVAGTVLAAHGKGAVRDAMSAAGEVGEVVLEHSVEAVKDVGTTVKEVGQALVSREVPLQPYVHRTPPVTEPTSRPAAPANSPDRASDVTLSPGVPSSHQHTPQPFNTPPVASQPKEQGESGYMQGVQAHAATVESARRKFEQTVSSTTAGAFQRPGTSTSTTSRETYSSDGSKQQPAQQQGVLSKASDAVSSTVQHTKGAVKDAAQAVGEVGMIAAAHTQGAASDVLQTAKEAAQALAGQKPQVQVTRTPDLVTDASSSGTTPQPYKEAVGAVGEVEGTSGGFQAGNKGGNLSTSMAEGRLRQMREDAKAEARAILAQGRQQSSGESSSPITSSHGQPGQGQQSSGSATSSPSIGERLSTAGQVIKEHAAAASQDLSQASQETSTVLQAHGELARRDRQQAMSEVKGGVPAQGPQVRESPPLVEGTAKAKSQPVARQWSAEQLQQGSAPDQIKSTGR